MVCDNKKVCIISNIRHKRMLNTVIGKMAGGDIGKAGVLSLSPCTLS